VALKPDRVSLHRCLHARAVATHSALHTGRTAVATGGVGAGVEGGVATAVEGDTEGGGVAGFEGGLVVVVDFAFDGAEGASGPAEDVGSGVGVAGAGITGGLGAADRVGATDA
jgi:hypothetical protein